MATIKVLKAPELLDELYQLQRERSDFSDLLVYVTIIDRPSYEIDQSVQDDTYSLTERGDGVVYAFTVPTTVHQDGTEGVIYIELMAVEWDNDDELIDSDDEE